MAALAIGTKAPQFNLQRMDGTKFSMEEALARGPILAVFFKISCPVCQYALPFFERIHKAYPHTKVNIVGISQNEKSDTEKFLRHYGITFPILLDGTKSFEVSNAYGLTNVPTAFWISEEGEIEISSVGWSRADFEEFVRRIASANQQEFKPVFQATEKVADFRAG